MQPDDRYVELAELAGGFIHEVKNHISTFGLNLDMLAEDFADPQTQRERRALDRIKRLQGECNRLVEVSNDFLRFARPESPTLEVCELGEVVEDLLAFVTPTARPEGIRITWHPGSNLPPVRLDADLFKQVLLNLVLNAEQAMPDGGDILLQAAVEADTVRLDVIDTGTGIPLEELPKIWKPFHTTKPGGTGLGLPTVRKIIEAHNGSITVESSMGHGTKFSIRLPSAP